MRRTFVQMKIALVILALGLVGCTFCRYSTPLQGGARQQVLVTGAGTLTVQGRDGITEVQVVGLACASDPELLSRIQLRVEWIGAQVMVTADLPDSGNRRLDLTVEGPSLCPLKVVTKSSGSVSHSNIGGKVEIPLR